MYTKKKLNLSSKLSEVEEEEEEEEQKLINNMDMKIHQSIGLHEFNFLTKNLQYL